MSPGTSQPKPMVEAESPRSQADPRPRALVVDDDDALARSYAGILRRNGFDAETATDGTEAMAAVGHGAFDVILSDIDMPRMGGVELLETIRRSDQDVQVVLITGSPSLETVTRAMEHGALRYLQKPVEAADLCNVVNEAVQVHRLARARREALEGFAAAQRATADRAEKSTTFQSALDTFFMAYQPIVSWSRQSVFGYEALLRSRDPRLPHPGAMLAAAEQLDRLKDLSRAIRAKAAEPVGELAGDASLFVNLHPADLLDPELFDEKSPLSAIADRVVLELTERAALHDFADARSRLSTLRSMGFRIAVDDLGAGYAGLTSFALLDPEIVKLDMGLVRDVHKEPTKRTMVRTLVAMCKELGKLVVAEGIETVEERDTLSELGCDLMQGYLFAKPGFPFPAPRF